MDALPVLQITAVFQASADNYLIFRSPRPWWAWQWELPTAERPVDPGTTLAILSALALLGLGLMAACGRREGLNEPEA
jgi:hypothetical protein